MSVDGFRALLLLSSYTDWFRENPLWGLLYLVFCDKGHLVPPMYDAHGPVSAPIFDQNSKNFDIVSAILSGD